MPSRLRWSVACVALAVFVLLVLQLLWNVGLAALDPAIARAFFQERDPWVSRAMLALSNSHSTWAVLGVAVLVGLWRFLRGDRPGAALMAIVPAGQVLNVGLKNLFERPRPVVPEPLVHLTTYSFPSGHAVASTLLYGALCALVLRHVRSPGWRIATVALAMAMVLLVSFSRVYLGAHYASDVLAGIAVGTFCVALVLRPRRG
jgi:membrane-associated phospholipid phosphatase